MSENTDRYSYNRFGKKGMRVGQAALDLLANNPQPQEVGETTEAMTGKYFKELIEAATEGAKKFDSPFYVVIVRKKETLGGHMSNILRQWYVRRQTKPSPNFLRETYPNADHDVYEIDGGRLEITHLWTLPTAQDAITVLKNKQVYDPQYVKWIEDFNKGELL